MTCGLYWPIAWLGLELNILAFIPVFLGGSANKKASIIYFVAQSCGSLMVLFGGLLGRASLSLVIVMLLGIILKIGLLPLHFWLPQVVSNLPLSSLYTLLS